MLIHAVYFWVKPDAPPDTRERMLADCNELLGRIPTVRHLWAGRPAMTPRDVVDNSYDVGLCVALDDKPGLAVYADHPLHVEFLKRHKQYWARIQVYDFL